MTRPSLVIGTAVGGALALAAALLPEIYQAAGKTVPDWMFHFSRLIIFAVFVIGIPTWLVIWVGAPAWRFHKSRRYHWPMVDKAKRDPNQWLFDIAREDANNPARHLVIREQTVTNCDLRAERYRPWIEFGLTLYNGGVHDILVGPAQGHANYKGNELPDKIESEGGSRKPRGHEHVYKLKQYLPAEIAEAIDDERRQTQKIRSLSLSTVRLAVQSEGPDGKLVLLPLGANDTFYAPE